MSRVPISALVALVAAWAAAPAAALLVTVGAHDDECFFENVEQSNKLMGSFEVISGGLMDVDVAVYGPQNEVHYSVQRQKTGTFSLLAPTTGPYRVCLSNRMSTMTDKTVAFSMHVGDELFRDVAKQEHITPLETEITQLADAIAKVEDEQQYMWARERAARDTNESTNARVLWFSVLEAVIMIVLGVWQALYLRSRFHGTGKA